MKYIKHILILTITLTAFSCGFYSLSGTNIQDNVKSFQVNYFQNAAAQVEPGIDRDFTIKLQDLIVFTKVKLLSTVYLQQQQLPITPQHKTD